MSRLGEIHDELRAEWSRLQSCWQSTREQWRDQVAESFERARWQEWDQRASDFLLALKELEETTNRALKETR